MKEIILERALGLFNPFTGWKKSGVCAGHFNSLDDCKRFEVEYVRDESTRFIFRVRGNRLQTLIKPERIQWGFYHEGKIQVKRAAK